MLIPQAIVQGSVSVWETFDCAPQGFSGTPTQRSSRYTVIGSTCIVFVDITGTSNATSFTFSLPRPTQRSFIAFAAQGTDNGSNPTSPFVVGTAAAPTSTATVFTNWNGGAFTASGAKSVQVTLVYEI